MEFLIRVRDGGNGMPVGGVVAARQNGADWTVSERTNADWRIMRCDGLTNEEVLSLMSGATIDGLTKKRQLHLESSAVVAAQWPRDSIPTVSASAVRSLFVLAP